MRKGVKRMTSNERRNEIISILRGRRQEKIANLAFELNVSIRTIKYDIEILMRSHPIETVIGRYGCVKLLEGYRIYENDISEKQQLLLLSFMRKAGESERQLLRELMRTHGSICHREEIEGGEICNQTCVRVRPRFPN